MPTEISRHSHSFAEKVSDKKSEGLIAEPRIATYNVLNPRWTTSYSEIKSHLKTGDIFLVHGRYPFSWVVELLQWSKWGHATMVIRREDIDPQNKHNLPEVMLWESNTDDGPIKNLWGPQAGQVKEGPMLISLEERLTYTQAEYDDVQIAYRPLLRTGLNFDWLPDFFDSMIDKGFPSDAEIIHSVYLGRRYNRTSNDPLSVIALTPNSFTGEMELTNINIDKVLSLSESDIDKQKIYCTELMATTYKQMGLLTKHHVSNAYSPKDFSSEGTVRFLEKAWLAKEIYINMEK